MIGRFILTILLAATALSLPRIWYVMKGGAGVRQFAVIPASVKNLDFKEHQNGPSLNDPSSAILRQYGSPHDHSNLDHSEPLKTQVLDRGRYGVEAISAIDAASLAALSQPYAYLSRGSQMIVFQSEDGKYVLKIPRAAKYGKIGESFLIAQNELQQETALLAIHLGKSFDVPERFMLKDGLGRRIPVHLDQTPFVLQRKMPLLKAKLEQAISQNDRREATAILSSFVALIDGERKKGVQSRDNAFSTNFAYENGKAYRLDIGAYEKKCNEKTLSKAAKPVRHYLARRDPELLAQFDELLQL